MQKKKPCWYFFFLKNGGFTIIYIEGMPKAMLLLVDFKIVRLTLIWRG